MKRSGLAILTALVSGAALAEEEKAADPRQGEEVDRICFGRDINNFKAIKGEDDAILLERGVNDWYKATLIGACSYRELNWAQSVAIEQHPAGGCVTSGDYLIFSRSAFGDFSFPNATRCAISEIYEWNPKAAENGEAEAPAED
ncbi:MAG: DUF6491 family protein [Pseudomonadota bacterium]